MIFSEMFTFCTQTGLTLSTQTDKFLLRYAGCIHLWGIRKWQDTALDFPLLWKIDGVMGGGNE